jgi:DHA1 family inner membrane transport protein
MTFGAVTLVGPLAMLALYYLVPKDKGAAVTINLKKEISTALKPEVLFGRMLTVLGFGGVFALFTYIAPILTDISKFSQAAISPILLLFGLGLIFCNIVGGKLADKKLMPTLVGSLFVLALVMVGFLLFSHNQVVVVILVFFLGFSGFATVAPLQIKGLNSAVDAPMLASALNIAAFNLGNALGAWVGGLIIDYGPGLSGVGWGGFIITIAALILAALIWKSEMKLVKLS